MNADAYLIIIRVGLCILLITNFMSYFFYESLEETQSCEYKYYFLFMIPTYFIGNICFKISIVSIVMTIVNGLSIILNILSFISLCKLIHAQNEVIFLLLTFMFVITNIITLTSLGLTIKWLYILDDSNERKLTGIEYKSNIDNSTTNEFLET